MISSLLGADQLLAQTAINDAIAAHGNAAKIAEAQTEMVNAATSIASHDYSGAIDHYKTAWQKAEDAF